MDNKNVSDFEIIDSEGFTPKKDEVYSHSSLLMAALKKVRENRAQEMKDGYVTTRFDRMGNAHIVVIPDSRKEFIESVEALLMIQKRDLDPSAKGKINKIKKSLEKKYKKYTQMEKEEWATLHFKLKQRYNQEGVYFREGLLSEKYLPYYKLYLRDKVDAYTKIVAIVQQSIKDLGEYGEEIFEA